MTPKSQTQTISLTLTEPQYEALMGAVRLMATTMEMDGPASIGHSPHVPRSLHAAALKLQAAWDRAVDGF
jgi:hypothetical protein